MTRVVGATLALVVVAAMLASCGDDEPDVRTVELSRTTAIEGVCDRELETEFDPFRNEIDAAVYAPVADQAFLGDLLRTAPEIDSVELVSQQQGFDEFTQILEAEGVRDAIDITVDDVPVRFDVVAAQGSTELGFRAFLDTVGARPEVFVDEALDACLPAHIGGLLRCSASGAISESNVVVAFDVAASSVVETLAAQLVGAGGIDSLALVSPSDVLAELAADLELRTFELELYDNDVPVTFGIESSDPGATVANIRELAEDAGTPVAELLLVAGVVGDDCAG